MRLALAPTYARLARLDIRSAQVTLAALFVRPSVAALTVFHLLHAKYVRTGTTGSMWVVMERAQCAQTAA